MLIGIDKKKDTQDLEISITTLPDDGDTLCTPFSGAVRSSDERSHHISKRCKKKKEKKKKKKGDNPIFISITQACFPIGEDAGLADMCVITSERSD